MIVRVFDGVEIAVSDKGIGLLLKRSIKYLSHFIAPSPVRNRKGINGLSIVNTLLSLMVVVYCSVIVEQRNHRYSSLSEELMTQRKTMSDSQAQSEEDKQRFF